MAQTGSITVSDKIVLQNLNNIRVPSSYVLYEQSNKFNWSELRIGSSHFTIKSLIYPVQRIRPKILRIKFHIRNIIGL